MSEQSEANGWRAWAVFWFCMTGAFFLIAAALARADLLDDQLAGHQAEMGKAQQQRTRLMQQTGETEAVILRLQGAIATLTELKTKQETEEKEDVETTEFGG